MSSLSCTVYIRAVTVVLCGCLSSLLYAENVVDQQSFVQLNNQDAETQMRQEVARFFELTQAIDVNPVKKRLNTLIHRQLKNNNAGIRQVHITMAENVINQQVDQLAENDYFFEQYYHVYKKFYTLQELRAINDFFASDAGKKFVGARGSLHREVSMASVKMIHRLVDQISPRVEDTLASSGYDVNL